MWRAGMRRRWLNRLTPRGELERINDRHVAVALRLRERHRIEVRSNARGDVLIWQIRPGNLYTRDLSIRLNNKAHGDAPREVRISAQAIFVTGPDSVKSRPHDRLNRLWWQSLGWYRAAA